MKPARPESRLSLETTLRGIAVSTGFAASFWLIVMTSASPMFTWLSFAVLASSPLLVGLGMRWRYGLSRGGLIMAISISAGSVVVATVAVGALLAFTMDSIGPSN